VKRNDPNKKVVKEYLFQNYGCICMVCGNKFERTELQLHHILKFEHTHTTTIAESSLVCDCCHKNINCQERTNFKEYTRINNKIRK